MSQPIEPTESGEVDRLIRNRTAELVRRNEALRDQLADLQLRNAELQQRFQAALTGMKHDREGYRAALNLMEDAVASRRAEQAEVAERRRVEAEMRDADRRKDEFLATLAHELRNPLAPIRNSLHILRMAGQDAAVIDRVFAMLERQVNHLVRLVDDLLEVSRINSGKIELRMEYVEVAAVLRMAVETSRPTIEAGRHQLAISVPSEPLTLHADPVRLSQVVSNLLNNAAKYTEPGGQIWLTVHREGPDAVISVRDTGVGIPPEMIPRLFEMFTQVNRTLGRSQGGLGIGLSLVRSLVEMHGGSVEARSEGPGQGSEFTVWLPLATEKVNAADAGKTQEQPARSIPRRILVVDDNHDAADSMAMVLQTLGVEVQVANNGPSALELLRTFRPSVVLLDIGMPEMDGMEVARRARQTPEGRAAVLVALTGWGQDEIRRRCKEAGFDHHLVKPVDLPVLQKLLTSLPANEPRPIRTP